MTLPQDPKVLCDFTWLVSMLFVVLLHGWRLRVIYFPPHVDVGVSL